MSDLGALYAALGTVAVAFLAYLGIRAQTKKPTPAPKTPTGDVFQGTPAEAQAYLFREVARLSTELDAVAKWRGNFTGALRRYFMQLGRWARAHNDELPHPDELDMPLLTEIFGDTESPWNRRPGE